MVSQSEPSASEPRTSRSVSDPAALVVADLSVLSLLDDPACRSILCVADEPLTAKELVRDCGLPRSTVYRKLEQLSQTPLVEETTRARLHGKHPQQYRRRFETVRICLPANGTAEITVSLEPRPPRETDVRRVPGAGKLNSL